MSTTFHALLGDRGRLVVPAELRARQGWEQGDPLLFIETPDGVVLMTREQSKATVRRQLAAGGSLVEALMAERRAAAAQEDIA
ncbi:MAG: AbrB/MazE/SpoVT family DNA-binding domain-containing protein [Arachnia sp.]